jgi:hypothetical protein
MSKLTPIHSIRLGNWIYAFGADFRPEGEAGKVVSIEQDDEAETTTLSLYVPGFYEWFGYEAVATFAHGDYVPLAETEVSREEEAA